MGVLQFKRGTTKPTLAEGEPFFDTKKQILSIGEGFEVLPGINFIEGGGFGNDVISAFVMKAQGEIVGLFKYGSDVIDDNGRDVSLIIPGVANDEPLFIYLALPSSFPVPKSFPYRIFFKNDYGESIEKYKAYVVYFGSAVENFELMDKFVLRNIYANVGNWEGFADILHKNLSLMGIGGLKLEFFANLYMEENGGLDSGEWGIRITSPSGLIMDNTLSSSLIDVRVGGEGESVFAFNYDKSEPKFANLLGFLHRGMKIVFNSASGEGNLRISPDGGDSILFTLYGAAPDDTVFVKAIFEDAIYSPGRLDDYADM